MMLNLLRSIFGIPASHHAPTTGQRTQGKPRPAAGGDWTALAKPDTQGTVTVYDPKGVPLRLNRGDEVAHGGEGVIYRFARNDGILIKVCKKETLEGASKLSLFRNRLNAFKSVSASSLAEQDKIQLGNVNSWADLAGTPAPSEE